MTVIQKNNLKKIDANLFLIFLSLMRHQNATVTANDMGLTQPAVSHALNRLRSLYGDQLFRRKSNGLEPTAFASRLEPKIQRTVRLMASTLTDSMGFDPAESSLSLQISAFDYEIAAIITPLITRLSSENPNIRVITLPLTSELALAALAEGGADLAVGYFAPESQRASSRKFAYETLYQERYVAVARQGHSRFRSGFTIGAYSAAPHLLISPAGYRKGIVDHVLGIQGKSRFIQSAVPSLFPALAITSRSDLVATIPSRAAYMYADIFNLDVFELALDGVSFPVSAVRHRRDAESPLHQWLVDSLHSVCGNSAGPDAPADGSPALTEPT